MLCAAGVLGCHTGTHQWVPKMAGSYGQPGGGGGGVGTRPRYLIVCLWWHLLAWGGGSDGPWATTHIYHDTPLSLYLAATSNKQARLLSVLAITPFQYSRLNSTLAIFGGMFARRATFVLSILLQPQVHPHRGKSPKWTALDRKPCLQSTLYKPPKYENSTTQNVTPTTSNHHPCHHHEPGAKDGPDS